jgi:hypothetical protein
VRARACCRVLPRACVLPRAAACVRAAACCRVLPRAAACCRVRDACCRVLPRAAACCRVRARARECTRQPLALCGQVGALTQRLDLVLNDRSSQQAAAARASKVRNVSF